MIRPYELGIALRYLKSRNRTRFVSFIALISILGIAIAVAVLITVMSVMNGFEYEVRQRILQVVSHGAIIGWDGRLDEWQRVRSIAAGVPGIRATAPYVSGQGMLVGDAEIKGAEIRGIDPATESATSSIDELMVDGSLDSLAAGDYRIVVGRELAMRLDAGVGDRVILIVPDGATGPAGLIPRMRRFEIGGIFYAGMYEFDRGLALISIEDASRLFRMDDAVTGIRIAVDDVLNAPAIVRGFASSLGIDVYITDWTRQHANFFRSIQLTKSIIFVILLLVVAVAAFNIVSTLVMAVRDKRPEIAILRTLGAPPSGILGLFVTQGTLIGLIGTASGVVLGLLVSANLAAIVAALESLLGFRFLAPDIYFISDFPSRIDVRDVLQIASIAVLLAFLSTIYPAWRGASMAPADSLRHE